MSNDRPRAVDPKRKGDEALNVADFKIDDILNVPGDRLLAEVAEDFGDPGFLAAQFDSIALPAVSSHNHRGVNWGGAMATFPAQPAALGAASARAFSRPPPATRWSSSRASLAILAEWLAVPLRRRIFLGTFATVLLVVALTPGIYPLLVNRSADRMTPFSQDEPLTQSAAPTLSGPLPTTIPASVAPADQSTEEAKRAQVLQQAALAERMQFRLGTEGRDHAAGLLPDRRVSALPSASGAPRAPGPQVAVATPVTAPPPPAARAKEGGGFFVELSAPRTAAEAQSIVQALKSKYAALKGHEPVIRRKDEGQRGVIYAVQLGPFESRDDADKLCSQLKTAGGVCFVTRN
jgi:cell division septation protein DedD